MREPIRKGKSWLEEEQILVLNLYFKLPFGQYDKSNYEVCKLANLLRRTPSSIAMKLGNYAHIDPTLDRQGLSGITGKDKEIWNRYWDQLDELGTTSEYLWESLRENPSLQAGEQIEIEQFLLRKKERYGTEVRIDQKRRIGQRFFRDVVLANYEYQCCVCRLKQPKLLEAAHIVDWSDTDDPSLRINPRNGMAMCTIHHKAFDQKLITIEPDDKIILLSSAIKEESSKGAKYLFHRFENSPIFTPEKFGPNEQYLRLAS